MKQTIKRLSEFPHGNLMAKARFPSLVAQLGVTEVVATYGVEVDAIGQPLLLTNAVYIGQKLTAQ